MAQYADFWKYHGENGLKFKRMIIDAGYIDKKVGFPISQMDNACLLEKYKAVIVYKNWIKDNANKVSKINLDGYREIKQRYFSELPKYHINRCHL